MRNEFRMIDDFDPRMRHQRHPRHRLAPQDAMGRGGFAQRRRGIAADTLGVPDGFGRGEHGRHRRARRGMLRDSVLVLLRDTPHNGYQIIVDLAERTGGEWQPSPGAVYPCLAQLADEGLIEPTHVDGQAVYQLTDTGREAAAALPEQPWAEGLPGRHMNDAAAHALWDEFRQLARVLRLAGDQASPDQLATITQNVAELRRRVFALLAEPADEAPQS